MKWPKFLMKKMTPPPMAGSCPTCRKPEGDDEMRRLREEIADRCQAAKEAQRRADTMAGVVREAIRGKLKAQKRATDAEAVTAELLRLLDAPREKRNASQ